MRLLVVFRGRHNEFREPELRAVVARHRGCTEEDVADLDIAPAQNELDPSAALRSDIAGVVLYGHVFCLVTFRSLNEAIKVVEQCLLIRAAFVLISNGRDYQECVRKAGLPTALEACADMMRLSENALSFRCRVEAFGRKYSMNEQLAKMERFHDLFERFTGNVNLKNPDAEFWIMEDAFPEAGHSTEATSAAPWHVFLGRKVALGAAHLGHEFHLSRRKYIGPTSMDAELAFVMANMAHAKAGSLILDPFCGTGSTLVSCARLGAHVIGSDLNMIVLKGKQTGISVETNFEQYDLPRPIGLLRADMLTSPFREDQEMFDAIVCDPPYGIKEGTRKSKEQSRPKGISGNFIQGTERVRLIDFVDGLLEFASKSLVPGGRLVFWLPTTRDFVQSDIPSHPCLKFVSSCEQIITMRMSRHLITLRRLVPGEQNVQASNETASTRMPSYHDFAAKVLRQPVRSDERLRPRTVLPSGMQ